MMPHVSYSSGRSTSMSKLLDRDIQRLRLPCVTLVHCWKPKAIILKPVDHTRRHSTSMSRYWALITQIQLPALMVLVLSILFRESMTKLLNFSNEHSAFG